MRPVRGGRVAGVVCSRAIKTRKAIALCAAHSCRCTPRTLLAGSGRAAVAATVLRPIRFAAIGVWAQATHYADDVISTKPWHIDFCFVPRSWASRIVNVAVIDGDEWRTRSDHLPLLVDVRVASRARTARSS